MCYWFILIGAAAFLMHGPLINFRQKLNALRWMYTFFFLFIYTSADRVNHMMRYVRRILCTHTKYSTKSIDSVMPIDLFCYSHLFTVTLNTTCHSYTEEKHWMPDTIWRMSFSMSFVWMVLVECFYFFSISALHKIMSEMSGARRLNGFMYESST